MDYCWLTESAASIQGEEEQATGATAREQSKQMKEFENLIQCILAHQPEQEIMTTAGVDKENGGSFSMTRWQKIEGLFYELIELAPEKRAAFLDQVCGDDLELRSNLQALMEDDAELNGINR
jgi:hypothetical protein